MSRKKALAAGAGAALILLAAAAITHFIAKNPVFIRGAVVTSDPDPARQLPIADAAVTLSSNPDGATRSDASGFFSIPIPLPRRMRPDLKVTLRFQHPDYQPLVLRNVAWDTLCIAHLIPLTQAAPDAVSRRGTRITNVANVVVRYSINTTAVINVGSAVKTFQVVNSGNVPCQGRGPCSPDGKWKAAIGSAMIDAGPGNEFRNARASCIAGPCPFTRIDHVSSSAHDSRTLRVSALDWSDTATFLLEAEVYQPVVSDVLRQSYPVIFERALTFTLPPGAQDVSIEAQLNGDVIVFPLGPMLLLSWANCQLFVNKDQTKVYRCELKPGYGFS